MRPAHYQKTEARELTPRQREVMKLIADGRTNGEIGESLGISLDGAKAHVRDIMTKLDASSRQDAVQKWRNKPSGPRKIGRWLRALATIPMLKLGGLAVGAAVVAAVVAVAVVSVDGSDPIGPDTAAEYTSLLDALDAIDGAAILETHSAEHLWDESIELRTAILYDDGGDSSQVLFAAGPDGEPALTQRLFDGVASYRYDDTSYGTEYQDRSASPYNSPSLGETRALMNDAASALQAAELAGVLARTPSGHPNLHELRVAAGPIDSAALLQVEPFPELDLVEADPTLRGLLLSCARIIVGTSDDSFHYAFIVNSSTYGLVGGRCWVEQGGEQRDVHSIYGTWIVHPADHWDALVAEIAPDVARMSSE